AALRSRDRRTDSGALAPVAAARSNQPRRTLREAAEDAARHIHRLRLAGSAPPPLRQPAAVAAARGVTRPASLRGDRRDALRHRPPHGREPALSVPRAALARFRHRFRISRLAGGSLEEVKARRRTLAAGLESARQPAKTLSTGTISMSSAAMRSGCTAM